MPDTRTRRRTVALSVLAAGLLPWLVATAQTQPLVRYAQGRLDISADDTRLDDLLQRIADAADFDLRLAGHSDALISLRLRGAELDWVLRELTGSMLSIGRYARDGAGSRLVELRVYLRATAGPVLAGRPPRDEPTRPITGGPATNAEQARLEQEHGTAVTRNILAHLQPTPSAVTNRVATDRAHPDPLAMIDSPEAAALVDGIIAGQQLRETQRDPIRSLSADDREAARMALQAHVNHPDPSIRQRIRQAYTELLD